MGKSKQTSTQQQTATQQRDPYAPAQPAINQSISGIQGWLSNPQSSAAYDYSMSPWTSAGVDTLGQSAYGNQALGHFSDVASGKYLNASNPWQADLDKSIIDSVMPSINNTFSGAGLTGSTLHQGSLSQGLTSALAAPRYQNYQAERQAQDRAAGLMPGLEAGIGQNQLLAGQTTEGYDRAQFEENRLAGLRPYLETAGLLQGYGNIGGTATSDSTGTTTSVSKPSVGSQIAGGALMGLGLLGGGIGGTIGQGMGGLLSGGLSGAQQGFAGMHDPSFWFPTVQR